MYKNYYSQKIIILILLLTLCSLCGCTPADPEPTTTPPPSTAATTTPPETTLPTEPQPPMLSAGTLQSIFQKSGYVDLYYQLPEGRNESYILLYLPGDIKLNNCPQITAPDLNACESSLRICPGDGSTTLTIYHGSETILHYEDGSESAYYAAENDELWTAIMQLRSTMEYQTTKRCGFSFDGSSDDALMEYGKVVLPNFHKNLPQDSAYRMIDYKFISCSIVDSTETTAWGTLYYNFQPAQSFGPLTFDAMPLDNGWYEALQNIAIEKFPDGLWYPVGDLDMAVATGHFYEPHPRNTTNHEAAAYLESVPSLLSALPEDDVSQILETAQIFVQCVTAVPMSGNFDFDWSGLCTEDAFSHVGMRSLWNLRIDSALYEAHTLTTLGTGYPFGYLVINDDDAILTANEIQIYLHKESGTWKIHDVSQPFAGT